MLVVKERKTVLLNLREPEQVMALIPGAKKGPIRGKEIVAVPHTDDTVRVLRNLGMAVPGGIQYYYDFPGRWPPFIHQRETAEFLTLNKRAYCLNGMGSGKTISALWAFDYLRKTDQLDWAVVICPLSTMERAWGDEIFRNFPEMTFGVVHGEAARRHKIALDNAYDVLLVNHDGIKDKKLLALLRTKPGRGVFIVDELAVFRNAGSDRWKALNWLINGHRRRVKGHEVIDLHPVEWCWGLTGTPIPKEPADAWAQCRIVTPWTVPSYLGAFKDAAMRKLTQYKWVAREGAVDSVHQVMQPAIRFAREDCIDLPPTTYVTREVQLTPEQKAMYKDMLSKFKAEYEGGQITAVNEAVKVGKLLQIVCGVAYGPDGDVAIPAKPRVDEVLDIIEGAEAKVIVFAPLTGALENLAAEIGKHYQVAVVQGGTTKSQRDRIFSEFMLPHGPRVLVAQPGTMAHGLSLTAANTIVWYAPVHSGEIYQQANERMARPGQRNNMLIVRIQGSELERRIYARLDSREALQGALLDLF